eukprot:CAMPEP_0205824288 /NCGR_PEP_ID=MMETSP0206-20130828/20296_1 /ASSEMBLY_ACC=CAM_ASM_000279 /TAXON_ID=36767 /ORGANISM="Euplotes focardii, Strain TN1" /LENGTH=372 /DNA_ID=CAMNT_0053122263 /DNA_START=13 /DNA_END=1131 /DNA_ORIENTATION=+
MSMHKDRIIEDLHRENTVLRDSPTRANTATHDLRATEHSLKFTMEERGKLEAGLRAQEDRDSISINSLDGERSHLKVVERERFDLAAKLKDELAFLHANVGRRREDLAVLHRNSDALRGDSVRIGDELNHERYINDGIRGELTRVNVLIDSNLHSLHEKRGGIDALNGHISYSQKVQGDLGNSLHIKDEDRRASAALIDDKSAKLKDLEGDICSRLSQIDDLKHRINLQNGEANTYSQDATGYAVRNSDLSARIDALKANIACRNNEISILNGSIVDLNDLYSRRRIQNDLIERDIDHTSTRVSALKYDSRGIGGELSYAADRSSFLYGNHGQAHYLHHKQRDYEHNAVSSEIHVDHVRSNSPARSPVRRYY